MNTQPSGIDLGDPDKPAKDWIDHHYGARLNDLSQSDRMGIIRHVAGMCGASDAASFRHPTLLHMIGQLSPRAKIALLRELTEQAYGHSLRRDRDDDLTFDGRESE